MKVLAFNSSPRKEKGISEILIRLFLEGAEEAGAETESHYVCDLDVKGCLGCFACWTETPGRCVHRDDMDWIITEWIEADVIYLGTPIYNYNITHYLQRLTERMLPTTFHYMEEREGVTRHPERHERRPQKTVLAAVAGFPGLENFDVAKILFPDSLHILLPSAQILVDPVGSKQVSFFTEAVKEAGRQIVAKGAVDDEVKKRLVVDYPPKVKDVLREEANRFFEEMQRNG
jgi:hypothetical protein